MRFLILFFLFCSAFCVNSLKGQDSLRIKKQPIIKQSKAQKYADFVSNTLLTKPIDRSPRKAAFLSMIIPGGGQFYNKQYYKVHFVYGALTAVLYSVDFNKRNYRIYRDAYLISLRGEVPPGFTPGIPSNSYKNKRDQFDKNLQTSYIGLGLVYIVNVADAFVSAHLSEFDVSEDLSAKIKLFDTHQVSQQMYPALGLTVQF